MVHLTKLATAFAAAMVGKKEGKEAKSKARKEGAADRTATHDGGFACVSPGVEAMCCIEEEGTAGFEGCLTCIMEVTKDVDENTTCADLASGSFCEDIEHCITEEDHCHYDKCKNQIEGYFDCAAANEETCEGLCEEKFGFAVDVAAIF